MIDKCLRKALTNCASFRGRHSQFSHAFSTLILRSYASHSSPSNTPSSPRKQVTIVNDDGRIQWKDLSIGEKAARTTQQTFNYGIVLTGLFLTGGVFYLLYTEVFSSDSKISHFNRAVDRIRADPRARELLGSGTKIRAFGEPTSSKWARVRPISSNHWKDGTGTEHIQMHFNVEGSVSSGVVHLHVFKKPDQAHFEYKYLALDVKGQSRIYLENVERSNATKKTRMRMFGVDWR